MFKILWKTTTEFFWAVGKWWWFLIIEEAIGIYIGTAQTFGHWSDLPKLVAPALVIIGVVLACFIAFHRLRLERDESLRKLFENSAHFKGELEQLISGECQPPGQSIVTRLIVKMIIVNQGAPSFARNFSMEIKCSDGRLIRGEPWWDLTQDIPIYTLDPTRPTQILPHGRYMPTLAMTSIPRGGLVYGYLGAIFNGLSLNEATQKDNRLVVKFHDIENKEFSCEYPIDATPNEHDADFYPGDMGVGVIPPPKSL